MPPCYRHLTAEGRVAILVIRETTHSIHAIARHLGQVHLSVATIGISDRLNEGPRALQVSMTYDQNKEMAQHAEISQRTGTAIYFANPHSPWQRSSNENSNDLRQYLLKGTDLSVYSQEELDAIADSLNTRPRRTLDWRMPLEVYAEVLQKSVVGPDTLHNSVAV